MSHGPDSAEPSRLEFGAGFGACFLAKDFAGAEGEVGVGEVCATAEVKTDSSMTSETTDRTMDSGRPEAGGYRSSHTRVGS